MQFPFGELDDGLVRVEEAATAEDASVPAFHAVAGNGERALVERLTLVVQLGQVDVVDRAHALASRAHAADAFEDLLLGPDGGPFLDGDRPDRTDRRHVEGEGIRRSDVGLAEPAEQHAQHRVGVSSRADRRAGVPPPYVPDRR